jgi:hypothetical protein
MFSFYRVKEPYLRSRRLGVYTEASHGLARADSLVDGFGTVLGQGQGEARGIVVSADHLYNGNMVRRSFKVNSRHRYGYCNCTGVAECYPVKRLYRLIVTRLENVRTVVVSLHWPGSRQNGHGGRSTSTGKGHSQRLRRTK